MQGRVAIVSLRFKPAFVSLLVAWGKAFQSLGCNAEYILDPAYQRFPELANVAPVKRYEKDSLGDSYTHAMFANVSPLHQNLASGLKKRGVRIIYIYHEPWGPSLHRFRTEGFREGITSALAHQLSTRMLKVADAVVLPSLYGAQVYNDNDSRYNLNSFYVPLLFDDEASHQQKQLLGNKQYFSYIGAICRGHGFDQFINFMRESFKRDSSLKFLIASANPLPEDVLKDRLISQNVAKIRMNTGRPLQNQEINQCYADSFCVWNVYRRSTQSAVLPKAFMFGTPVLASPIGAFLEYVKDGVNGKFASGDDLATIQLAIEDIQQNLENYSVNSRKAFIETFFYRSHLQKLEQLL